MLVCVKDPLGIAVQQTFGIGLGFNFDHMSKLPADQEPSTRRLQARAAKSAIRRAQEIFDVELARKELDAIQDPTLRDRRAKELRKKADDEMKHLASRLTELVPTNPCPELEAELIIQQYTTDEYTRTSSNQYIMKRPLEQSPAIQNLLKNMKNSTDDEVDYLNPLDSQALIEKDDEFVEEWLRRASQKGEKGTDNDDDDDDDDKVLLLA